MLCRGCNTVVGHIERTGPISYWGTRRDQRCIDYVKRWRAGIGAA